MESNPNDDELLRSYLLGGLTGDEADDLERRLLKEDDLFELSEAIEADLLAEYAQGGLAPAERERVQQWLASSPQVRERLKLTRSLSILAGREKPAVLPFVRRAAPTRQPALRWTALAAGLLAAAGLAWFTWQQPHPTDQKSQEQPGQVIAETSRAHEVPAPPPTPPPVAPAPKPVVFELALMSLRGSEPVEKLRVRANAGTVELHISVVEMDNLQSFHLTLQNRKGETVKAWTRLKPRSLNGVRTLIVDLPAEKLPDGKYDIQAQGLAPGGELEDLSPLEFEVVREKKG
jgi:hypothetical protein